MNVVGIIVILVRACLLSRARTVRYPALAHVAVNPFASRLPRCPPLAARWPFLTMEASWIPPRHV